MTALGIWIDWKVQLHDLFAILLDKKKDSFKFVKAAFLYIRSWLSCGKRETTW